MRPNPTLLGRFTGLIDIQVRTDDPDVVRYRVSGHKALMGAFAGATTIFEVEARSHYRSPTVVRRGQAMGYGGTRNTTRMSFNMNDFQPISPLTLPTDDCTLHLRLEEYSRSLGAYMPPGPILVVPNAVFFGLPNASYPLSGTAPAISATAGDVPPPGSLAILPPRGVTVDTVSNADAADTLLFSFGEGMPMAICAPSQGLQGPQSTSIIYAASANANTVDFTMILNLVV